MKRITGTLGSCLQQATDVCSQQLHEEKSVAALSVRCQLQGPLVTGLYLVPGETEGITLKRLGEAISTQARISPCPLEQQPALLDYDDTSLGQQLGNRRLLGTLSLAGENEPVALLYWLYDEAKEPRQQ
jgi:hypothetical protein